MLSELRLTDMNARLKGYKNLSTKTGKPKDYAESEFSDGQGCIHVHVI